MSQQMICDECGEPIDQADPFIAVSASKQQLVNDVPTVAAGGEVRTFDFHVEHTPATIAKAFEPEQPLSATEPAP